MSPNQSALPELAEVLRTPDGGQVTRLMLSVMRRTLPNHLSTEGAGLLAVLKESMGADGRDLHIGPSYLMRPDVDTR